MLNALSSVELHNRLEVLKRNKARIQAHAAIKICEIEEEVSDIQREINCRFKEELLLIRQEVQELRVKLDTEAPTPGRAAGRTIPQANLLRQKLQEKRRLKKELIPKAGGIILQTSLGNRPLT